MGGLLSAFKKQTGQDYNGDEQQTNMLSSLAHQVRCRPKPLLLLFPAGVKVSVSLSSVSTDSSPFAVKVTGTNIPPSILGKLAKSQMSGMF